MKSILNSKNKDTIMIVLVKCKKNKKYKAQFRFFKVQKDALTELTVLFANYLHYNLTKHGYIEIENTSKENIDFANETFWILRDFVNTTDSDKEILRLPRFYIGV